jgi:hypothetical protein
VAYLLSGEDGSISISNFRLLVRFWNGSHRSCVFSTADAAGWRFLLPSSQEFVPDYYSHLAGRVDGCLYLPTIRGSLMVLDNASLEFSEVLLPSCKDFTASYSGANSSYIVVHGGSSPTSRIVHVYGDDLEVFGRVDGSGDWILQHRARKLSEATRGLPVPAEILMFDWEAWVISAGTGYVIVAVSDDRARWVFSVDVETMVMKAVPESAYHETLGTWSFALPWPSFIPECPRV